MQLGPVLSARPSRLRFDNLAWKSREGQALLSQHSTCIASHCDSFLLLFASARVLAHSDFLVLFLHLLSRSGEMSSREREKCERERLKKHTAIHILRTHIQA